jgi:hypothetical protein
MDELDPIYSNAALRQQVTRCSCSTHHWWAYLGPHHLPFALVQTP